CPTLRLSVGDVLHMLAPRLPYASLFRSGVTALITTLAVMSGFQREIRDRMLQMTQHATVSAHGEPMLEWRQAMEAAARDPRVAGDRKSTRLNSSHVKSSYAVFCWKKKNH